MKRSPAYRVAEEADVDEFAYVVIPPYQLPKVMAYASSLGGKSHHVTPELALDAVVDAWIPYMHDTKRISKPRIGHVIELVIAEDSTRVRTSWGQDFLELKVPPLPKPREVKPWERGVPLGIYFYENPDETQPHDHR